MSVVIDRLIGLFSMFILIFDMFTKNFFIDESLFSFKILIFEKPSHILSIAFFLF